MSLLTDRVEVGIQEAELEAQKALAQFPPILRLVVILVILAIIPSYYIAKNISQKIWLKKYQANLLVAKPSFTNALAPTTTPVSVTSLGPNQYAAITKVTNQNLDLAVDQAPYQFAFFNAQKQQIYSYSGKLYLLPNQSKYITVPTFTTTEQVAFTNFQFTGDLAWQKRLSIPTVQLTTSLPITSEQLSPLAFAVSGDFFNNSPYSLAKVRLTFVLFDQSNTIIGVSQRNESTVAPFERRTYVQLWPNLAAPNLSRVEVTADTDTLDPTNLSVSASPSGSAGDLSHPATKQNGF